MGDWAKWELSKSELPKRCYIFGGNTPKFVMDSIISKYEEVIFHKHDNYEPYIVSDGITETLLMFQVYGPSMVADLVYILNDGNVDEIIFIGSTYGIDKNLRIGDYIVPNKVQSLDGIIKVLEDVDYTYPSEELKKRIIKSLISAGEDFKEGTTISVPTTFWHPDESKYDQEAIALEMEFASLCYFSSKFNIKTAGLLVVSDTANHSLKDDPTLRYKNIIKGFEILHVGT